MEDQRHQLLDTGFPEAVPGLMNPDGDPLRPVWIPECSPEFEPYKPFSSWDGFQHEIPELPVPLQRLDPWDVFQPASPGSRPSSVASSYGSIASGVSHPPRTGNKRKKRVDITWSEFDEFGKDGDESKARKRKWKEEPDAKRFACPFEKHNLQEFPAFRICGGLRWESVLEVKEHIFRRHMCSELHFQCCRCYDEFASETALHDHQRADNPCEKKPVSNRINVQQEKQLRSQKLYQKSLDDEEKWRLIYRIIFPDAEVIPSPYDDPELANDYYTMNLIEDGTEQQHGQSTFQHYNLAAEGSNSYYNCVELVPPVTGEVWEKGYSKQTENQVAPTSPRMLWWPGLELDETIPVD